MSGKEQKYIKNAFESNWIAPLGPNVDAFENEISNYLGVKGAVAVSSGTAAIHLALSLLEVDFGDTVFCSSLTFVASANPILYQKAQPVFIDSEPETWNMSPIALEKALKDSLYNGKLPKAVIVVNLYGQSAKMDDILEICNFYGVPVIEDAAESLGTIYKGRNSGTLGKFGILSFNGNKIITTSGGGMIVSDDTNLLMKARFLATQARDNARHYQHSIMGYNYRMSNVLAGIGRGQLEVLDDRISSKRRIHEKYSIELGHIKGLEILKETDSTRSNYWLTVLTINEDEMGINIDTLLKTFDEKNIEVRPVWKPLHLQPLFRGYKYFSHGTISVSDKLFNSGICLPSGSNMSEEDQDRVIQVLKQSMKIKV
ncbi:DegT/DnrJ/EryC1/StrS family aminotransferase [Bacillus sp. 1P02SD]|uniref:DegT/DnrJ/EryC1/StrS family aminotransferase n=1 Tax=Bacillus sp. 1P02SD TaxID=3132264 RepID=UPI00399FAE5F